MPRVILIDDFSGGMNLEAPEKIGFNQFQSASNIVPAGRSLRTSDGIIPIGGISGGTTPEDVRHTRFYKTGQAVDNSAATTTQAWTVAAGAYYDSAYTAD